MAVDDTLALAKATLEALPTKEAYQDLAKPGFQETGKALGTVASLLNSALRPVMSAQLAWNNLFDRLDAWIRADLKGVPEEELRAPPAVIVGGVLPGLLFAQDEPELRALFVRLLATSMRSSTSAKAHPAFAELIKQMTPLEARLISDLSDTSSAPFLRIRSCIPQEGRSYEYWDDPKPGMTLKEIEDLSGHYRGESWDEDRLWSIYDVRAYSQHTPLVASLENLQRLSLIEISSDTVLGGESADSYVAIAGNETVLKYVERTRRLDRLPWISQGSIHLTAYGNLFVEACVTSPATARTVAV
jgi:hypothetical protein